jgi:hypothetical protein
MIETKDEGCEMMDGMGMMEIRVLSCYFLYRG